MKLRYKVLGGTAIVLVAGTVALGLVLSHDSPCRGRRRWRPTRRRCGQSSSMLWRRRSAEVGTDCEADTGG